MQLPACHSITFRNTGASTDIAMYLQEHSSSSGQVHNNLVQARSILTSCVHMCRLSP